MSIVRNNLLTRKHYTPYCGDPHCKGNMPRLQFIKDQFECFSCGYRTKFEPEFIEQFKKFKETYKDEPKPIHTYL
jgi:hypothetical protein